MLAQPFVCADGLKVVTKPAVSTKERRIVKGNLLSLSVMASLGHVSGCPRLTPPEAVLAGAWSVTPDDTGEFDGLTYEARFDADRTDELRSAKRA